MPRDVATKTPEALVGRSGPEIGPAIVIEEITKSFRTHSTAKLALDGLSAEIPCGKITALFGPDGAGKTTLLRIIAGLIKADAGRIIFPNAPELRNSLGYMPQRFGLYDDLSVQENLNLYAALYGVRPEDKVGRITEVIGMFGLEHARNRLAGRLSGGMRQKLTLGTVLLRPQQLLLLDEPTIGMDPLSRREIWEQMDEQVRWYGTTILITTNLPQEAERCGSVICLQNGKTAKAISSITNASPKLGMQKFPRLLVGVDTTVISLSKPACSRNIGLIKEFTGAASVAHYVPPEGQASLPGHGQAFDLASARTIIADDVSLRFGTFWAVHNVSLSAERGEIFGLLGANGAGKSTLIRMLCGLIKPTSGRLHVAGFALDTAARQARSRVGYVPQRSALYSNLTVRQNLQLFAVAYAIKEPQQSAVIDQALNDFDLTELALQDALTLGQGLKQRLAIACALLHAPEVLVLDEPTSGLDMAARENLWSLIEGVALKGTTVLISTHDMTEADRCDRVAVMSNGEVLAEGSPLSLRRSHATQDQPLPSMEQVVIDILESRRSDLELTVIEQHERTTRTADSPAPRIAGLIGKESLQVLRDPSSVILALLMPLFLLLLFGFGVSLDPKSVPLALVLDRPNAVSESLVGAFAHSPYFDTRILPDMQTAMRDLANHTVLGVLHIKPTSTRDLVEETNANVQLLLNGVDANTARIAESYVHGALSQWNVNWINQTENRVAPPIFLQPLIWFNRNTLSNWFLVPGLFGIIMALTGTLLSALAVAREWERGSLEMLFTTRTNRVELVLGKLVPYTCIGLVSSSMALAIAAWVFSVPVHAPLFMILALILLFLLVSVGFGIVIANRTRNQFGAAVMAILGSFMPAFLLSGFIFDPHSMPAWFSYVTYLVPARYVVDSLRTMLLVGPALGTIAWDVVPLTAIGLLLIVMAFRTTKWRPD